MADQRELPEELLLNILWRLKLSTGSHNAARDQNRILARTLFSCLLANKTLSRLAKPVLYHTINHKDLFSIAHHLAHNPALADRVRELSAYERSCHDFVRVIDEDDDRQWPEYLRDRMSAFRSCSTYQHSHEDNITSGFRIPIATFALLVCTKNQILVMHSTSPVPPALAKCFIEGRPNIDPNDSKNTYVPLARLRELTLRYPPLPREPGPESEGYDDLEAGFEFTGSDWAFGFIQLPQLESISLYRLPTRPWHFQARSSGLKRLMLIGGSSPILHTPELEDILKTCPLLECVEARWMWKGECRLDMKWATLGAALTRHGSNLRKLTLHYSHIKRVRAGEHIIPINLASLSHLRDLSLPLEAFIPETPDSHSGSDTDEDEPYSYDHESTDDERSGDEGSDNEGSDNESSEDEQDLGVPLVPLCQLLPYSLQHLIIDDVCLLADEVPLDEQLRNLMLDTQFAELRSIRVSHREAWSKQLKDLGWHEERDPRYWNALVRP